MTAAVLVGWLAAGVVFVGVLNLAAALVRDAAGVLAAIGWFVLAATTGAAIAVMLHAVAAAVEAW